MVVEEIDRYPGQPKDEVTQHVFFKSVFAITPFLFASLILGLVSLYGIYYGARYQPKVSQQVAGLPLNIAFLSLIMLIVTVLLTWGVVWVWRRNRIVVTNEHIVDIDQRGIFNKKVSTLSLVKIQDVTAKVRGPWQTLFQYGTVIIQTAGEKENFSMDYISYPYQTEQYILEVHRQFVHKVNQRHLEHEEGHAPSADDL